MLIHGYTAIDPNGGIDLIFVICNTLGINPGISIITGMQSMSHSTLWKGYADAILQFPIH